MQQSGPTVFLAGNTTDRCMGTTCSNLHTERFEVLFKLLDEEQGMERQ